MILFLLFQSIPCERAKLLEYESSAVFEKIMLHSITRIQIPDGEFITRLVYLARWKASDKNCCRNTSNIKWLPLNMICDSSISSSTLMKTSTNSSSLKNTSNMANVASNDKNFSHYQTLMGRFWGSEVVTYAAYLKTTKITTMGQLMQVTEQTSSEVFKYVNRVCDKQVSSDKTRNKTLDLFSQFLSDAKFTEMDVVKIYSDFVQHCYPSLNMSFVSFQDYCQRIKMASYFDEKNISFKNIFKAMNYKVKNYIAFNEFLLGMASIDQNSPHTQPRYTYIFRYYDSDSDGYLDREDLRRLLQDVQRVNKNLDVDVETTLTKLIPLDKKMNYDSFVNEINTQRLKGTGSLCRTTKSIMNIMNEANAYELIINRNNKPFGSKIVTSCPKCKPKTYSLATHTVKLSKTGRIEDPKILNHSEIKDCGFDQDTLKAKALIRKHSIEFIFRPTSNSNYVLNLVRKLSGYCRMTDDKKKEVRTQVVNGLSVNVIRTLCDEVSEILSVEPRVIKVNTPTFVLGDIHGNINDLLIFEEQLWPMAPSSNAPSVLFLGDYVDRGEFSIEVVSYLFAMKILAPTKFFLLRGNHEVRAIQRSFTFEKECLDKYGTNGASVFETFNRVFDILPFSALIDESIYCAHGGIPFTQTKIEDLLRTPAVLQDPEQEAPAVWEVDKNFQTFEIFKN